MTKKDYKFELMKGEVLAGRFCILNFLGSGSEGEVYKVEELHTRKLRAIKLFYPEKNKQFKVSIRSAQKLDKLRSCPIVIDYLSHEIIDIDEKRVACLITEYVKGESLEDFICKQKGKRLGVFPALHLLYSMVLGVEGIHLNGEYHGDLHVENIIIKRFGLEFDLKIIDLHHWGDSKKENREEDIIKIIQIFYETLGGAKYYSKLAPSLKNIICGQKRSLILKKFKNISSLKNHLERMDWSDAAR